MFNPCARLTVDSYVPAVVNTGGVLDLLSTNPRAVAIRAPSKFR